MLVAQLQQAVKAYVPVVGSVTSACCVPLDTRSLQACLPPLS